MEGLMRLKAMAKINLGLDVLGKREDGYHEVRMIMQTIRMYDILDIRKTKRPGIVLTTNLPFIPTDSGCICRCEPDVSSGPDGRAADGARSEGRSRCSVLHYAWNSPCGGNR